MKNLNRLTELLGRSPLLRDQQAAVEALAARMGARELTISVMGQFKRGKSSLINRMLREEVLPVGIIPLTSAVTEIRRGPEFRALVCLESGEELPIPADRLADYCSEQRNPGNEKGVRALRLWTPQQPFGQDIVLVDTPGVGSVHRNNTDVSYDYVAQSDAVIFLLSVDSPVSETERDFLLKAREYAGKFYFAVNKCDVVSPADLEDFIAFCREVLSRTLEAPVTLRPVSAKTGAGVRELTEALASDLTAGRDQVLEASLDKKLDILLGQAKAKLNMAVQTASLPAEQLECKLQRMEEKRREVLDFSDGLQGLTQRRTQALIQGIQDEFSGEKAQFEQEMVCKANELYGQLKQLPAREFRSRLQQELNGWLRQELSRRNSAGIARLTQGYEGIVELLSRKTREAEGFIADLLREEFGLAYPLSDEEFSLSSESDFFLRIGIKGVQPLRDELLDSLLPRKWSNAHFLRRSIQRAKQDIDHNESNMLYNYRYKTQESLRPLYSSLSGRMEALARELDGLTAYIREHLSDARSQYESEAQELRSLLEELEAWR